MYIIIGTDADTQTVSQLITENRSNGSFKVNGIKSTLKRIAEHNAGISFSLKHELAFFLGAEAAYGKQ